MTGNHRSKPESAESVQGLSQRRCLNFLNILLSVLAVLGAFKNAHASIRFERISVEQGLSQSAIHCILQDRKGFLWFGTWDGLNRYDGYQFVIFKKDPNNPNSLCHNTVKALYEDHTGVIWIGTDGGLSKYEPEQHKFTNYRHMADNPFSLSHNSVKTIYEDHNGLLWIGTENGLNQFNPKTDVFVRWFHNPNNPHSLSHNRVRVICEDNDGTLWIGTEGGGANRLDPTTGVFTRYVNHPENPQSLSHDQVRSICKDSTGTIWIGTEQGLNRFDRDKGNFFRYLYDPMNPRSLSFNGIWTIYEDSEHVLWIGTDGGGLNRLDSENGTFTRFQYDPRDPMSLSHNVVWSIYEDRSGVLWIGTYTGGLNKYVREKEQFLHYQNDPDNPNSLSHNNVWAIYEDANGILWVGTDKGLDRFDRRNSSVSHFRHDPLNPSSLSHNEVWAICEDRNHTLWIGTYFGLNRLESNPHSSSVKGFTRYLTNTDNHSNKIRVIRESDDGMLWIGTEGGLICFDPTTGQSVHFYHNKDDPQSLSHNNVWAIYIDSSRTLWAGTENGLNRLVGNPPKNNVCFIQYHYDPTDPYSISDDWVVSIYEDKRGTLWFGTVSGLNRFDRQTETFICFREKDGLPNDFIYGILEDDNGNLWISSNKGLSKFNPDNQTFKNFSLSDGLQSSEFNIGSCYKNEKGELFFGGINGFNIFTPIKINNPHPPTVVLTDFRIFNQSVPLSKNSPLQKSPEYTDAIQLSYKDRVISFEFAAIHFSSPEKNRYEYLMEGFDCHWIHSGKRRFATYTNLPPGRYTFKVRASSPEGVWSKEGISISVSIAPPFWRTWWAYLLYVLTSLSLIFGYIKYKTRIQAREIEYQRKELEQKRQQAELLEKRVEERTQELYFALEEARLSNKQMTDSLQYARLIQQSLLPNLEEVQTVIPKSFFIWIPRHIVSGDLYFFHVIKRGCILAIADCTGHGVPGALMTMIAFSGLKRIISDAQCVNPAEILSRLNVFVKTTLQQNTPYALSNDGLDISLCMIEGNESNMTLRFAGARLSLYCVKNGELRIIKGDRQSIGYKHSDLNFRFSNYMISIEKGMSFYMATDGYTDQQGGPEHMKFGIAQFGKILIQHACLPFEQQKEILLQSFYNYKGTNQIRDDVTVIGFGF